MSFQVGIGSLSGTVFFQVGFYTPLRTVGNGGVQAAFLYDDFSRFFGNFGEE